MQPSSGMALSFRDRMLCLNPALESIRFNSVINGLPVAVRVKHVTTTEKGASVGAELIFSDGSQLNLSCWVRK